jgi:hypothetical protein
MDPFRFTFDESNPDRLAEVRCPSCETLLSVHAPDPELPDRLLGTCGVCRSWYLMDCRSATMILLPDTKELRAAASGARPSPGSNGHSPRR